MINVFLVEDHKIVREGIRKIIETESDLVFTGEAENGMDAADKLNKLKVDVAIVDLNMPEMNGIELTKHINKHFADTKVLILTMLDNENYLTQVFDAGASGYITKTTGKEELIRAIHMVASGEVYISHKLSLNLLKAPKALTVRDNLGKSISVTFSKKEIQILQLMAEGLTNEEIADKTFTSKRTVETHRKNMIEKSFTRNSVALMRFVLINGIIS